MDIFEKPLDHQCPECQALMERGEEVCPACGAKQPLPQEEEKGEALSKVNVSNPNPYSYSLGFLMTLMTLFCVCLGIGVIFPGLGIGLAIILTPALFRVTHRIAKHSALGIAMDWEEKIVEFLGSVGVVLAIVISSGAAFFATCWVGGLAAIIGKENFAPRFGSPYFIEEAVIFGILLGLVPGIYVAKKVICWLWPVGKKPKTGGEPDELA